MSFDSDFVYTQALLLLFCMISEQKKIKYKFFAGLKNLLLATIIYKLRASKIGDKSMVANNKL